MTGGWRIRGVVEKLKETYGYCVRAKGIRMRVDTDLICEERKRRAWSQEHLASVAGLGLRTVQRIESSGNASFESVSALASVLEVSVEDLCIAEEATHPLWRPRSASRLKAVVAGSVLIAAALLALNRTALAEQDVLLDVDAVVNGEQQTEARILNRAGENTELMIWKDYRLHITPAVLDNGDVRMTLNLQKLDGGQYVQVAGPRIVTPNGQQATIKSGWQNGDSIVIEITPTIQADTGES